MRGQTADAAERGESACALRERRFGNVGNGWAWAGVLHEPMVNRKAKFAQPESVYSSTAGRKQTFALLKEDCWNEAFF